jgi:NADP-dependent 3-hydroxy acid dehydrogenase YdfG
MRGGYRGKVCIVTGAVSRMGRALSCTLLERGAAVFMADVSDQALKAQADRLNARHSGRAFAIPSDPAHAFDAQRLVDGVVAQKGRIDSLFMTAVAPCALPIDQVMAESWRYAIDVNVMGLVNMVEAVLPTMRGQGGGHIVSLLPLSALVPVPYEAVCSATHAAARALIESLRYELWDEKIRCAAACLDGVFGIDMQLPKDDEAQKAATAVLSGMEDEASIIIWPDTAQRELDGYFPLDSREKRLCASACERRGKLYTKGSYI